MYHLLQRLVLLKGATAERDRIRDELQRVRDEIGDEISVEDDNQQQVASGNHDNTADDEEALSQASSMSDQFARHAGLNEWVLGTP
jgi:hypothetical protein